MTSYLETFLALALSIFKHTEYILLKKKRKFTEYIWWIVKKAHSDSDSDSDSLVKKKLHVDVVWSQSQDAILYWNLEMHFHTSHKEVNTNIQLQTTSIYVESANKLFHTH